MIKEIFRYAFFFVVCWLAVLFCDLIAIILFIDVAYSSDQLIEYIQVWHEWDINNKILQNIMHIYLFPIMVIFIGFNYSDEYAISIYFLIRGGIVYLVTYLLIITTISEIKYIREEKEKEKNSNNN
tara:strand:+ start:99 stop:476 length:378 start_codon:yes stop_codon:yes gene_type:complete